MADIQYWDDTLNAEIEYIQSIVDSVSNTKSEMERSASLDEAEKKLRAAKRTKRSYKMETRLVSEANQRRKYENQILRHEESLVKIEADLKAHRTNNSREQLFVGGGNNEIDPEVGGDSLLKDASRLQNKTQDSINRTKQMVTESKEVGLATVEELHRQREQIENIDKDADRMGDELNRADLLIKTFMKRMATDKIFQCFALTNCLLLVGVVIYAIIDKGGLSPKEGDPESPLGT